MQTADIKSEIKKVVIAGGGTAGWLAAAALSRQLGEILDITLVESEDIGTVGVGEATIPPIRVFHKLLGIDERTFMRSTEATFKLGIAFEHWGRAGERYIHSFGKHGRETWVCDFHHFWLRGLQRGFQQELGDYCVEWQAANAGKFATSLPSDKTAQANANTQSPFNSPLALNYAYHLDAALYAKFLRRFSEGYGVARLEGKIRDVRQNPETGFIDALILDDGRTVAGDLFIDCTGFKGLLIEQTLHTGYDDWSHWLPCDSAVAVQTETTGSALPYTRSIAHQAGWRWRIPLRHRVGNGLVYCSRFMSDEQALNHLLQAVDGKTINSPRVIRF